jgi:hypothetical protein
VLDFGLEEQEGSFCFRMFFFLVGKIIAFFLFSVHMYRFVSMYIENTRIAMSNYLLGKI